jgi:hypothetical protein
VDEIAAKLLRQLEKQHLWTITDADVVVWKTYLRNVQEQKKQQHVEKMLGGDSNVHYASVQQHAQQLSAPSHQQQPLSLTAQPYFHAVPTQLEPSRFLIAPEQQDVVVWPSNTINLFHFLKLFIYILLFRAMPEFVRLLHRCPPMMVHCWHACPTYHGNCLRVKYATTFIRTASPSLEFTSLWIGTNFH